ncbi:hypothetical protein [Pseudoalteromonas xiamenensis]|nr:hypothetical protein [Pseudoalteromonas xiamenensis]
MTKSKQPINQQSWFVEFKQKMEHMKGVETQLPSGSEAKSDVAS